MSVNLQEEYNKTNIQGVIDQLEEDLVGLAPVKQRIREIAALLLVQRLRKNLGMGLILRLWDYTCPLQVAQGQERQKLLIEWQASYSNLGISVKVI